jgi:sulfonate transport system substrate-binding protein
MFFKQYSIPGSVEPWVSRLETEAAGRVLIEEPDAATTVLVSSVKFRNENRELAKKFWQAHREPTDWVLQNSAQAQKIVQAELLDETRAEMSGELIARAWKRIIFTSEIPRASNSGVCQQFTESLIHEKGFLTRALSLLDAP